MTPLLGWFFAAAFVTAAAIGLDVLRSRKRERDHYWKTVGYLIREANAISRDRGLRVEEVFVKLGCDCDRCKQLREGKASN